jgi:hypothetical protein
VGEIGARRGVKISEVGVGECVLDRGLCRDEARLVGPGHQAGKSRYRILGTPRQFLQEVLVPVPGWTSVVMWQRLLLLDDGSRF